MNLSKTQYPMPCIKSILLLACLLCYTSAQAIWLSPDPLLDKYPYISPYAYCNWNPINYVDPNGLSTHTDEDGNVVAVYDDNDLNIYKHSNSKISSYINKTSVK